MNLDLDALAKAPHSIFGPSYSSTWLNCAASILAGIHAPDTAGIDAAMGTLFHEVMENWLKFGPPTHMLHTWHKINGFDVEVDQEMWDYARQCVEWVADIPGERFVETKVDFSDLTPIPHQRGTNDLAIVSGRVLYIRDWKYGKGVAVRAQGNTQALLYGYGAWREWDWLYDFEALDIGIGQPRQDSFTTWRVTIPELLEFAAFAKERAYAAWQPNAPYTPGEKQCRFCRVRERCPAKQRLLEELIDGVFDDLSEPKDMTVPKKHDVQRIEPVPAVQLTNEQIAQILPHQKMMERWFADVRAEAVRRAEAEQTIPGYHLTRGRNSTRWRSEEKALAAMARLGLTRADLTESSVVSPNKAKDALRRIGVRGKLQERFLATLTEVSPGKPTLVSKDDDRPALESGGDVFDDLG